MSYVRKIEYTVVPKETFKIVRGCSGCGCKQIFASRNAFRINANGNKLDVWLIYGCEKCNHTYNLPIYERISPAKVPQEEYAGFLANDEEAVFLFGTKKEYFTKNRAEIAWDLVEYSLVKTEIDGNAGREDAEKSDLTEEVETTMIEINNPYHIPVRADKLASEIMNVTRSQVKKLIKAEKVIVSIH